MVFDRCKELATCHERFRQCPDILHQGGDGFQQQAKVLAKRFTGRNLVIPLSRGFSTNQRPASAAGSAAATGHESAKSDGTRPGTARRAPGCSLSVTGRVQSLEAGVRKDRARQGTARPHRRPNVLPVTDFSGRSAAGFNLKFVQGLGALSPPRPGEPSEKIVTVRTTARTQAAVSMTPGPAAPAAPGRRPLARAPRQAGGRSVPGWARARQVAARQEAPRPCAGSSKFPAWHFKFGVAESRAAGE